jgi:prevent-host-death family protein
MDKNMVMTQTQVNIFEIKARLSEYLDRVARGERIIVCRHNRPVAELRPLGDVRRQPRPIGPLPGEVPFEVPPSFFEPLPPEELDAWEGVGGAEPVTSRPAKSGARVSRVADRRALHGTRPGRGRGGKRS